MTTSHGPKMLKRLWRRAQHCRIIEDATVDLEHCQINNTLLFESGEAINWRFSFLLIGCLPVTLSLVYLIIFPKNTSRSDVSQSNIKAKSTESSVSIIKIVQEINGLLPTALACGLFKGVRYWFYYWLPDYLYRYSNGQFSIAQASMISSAPDVGCLIAFMVTGPMISKNRFVSKTIPPLVFASIMSFLCIPIIYLTSLSIKSGNILFVIVILIILGFLLSTDNIHAGIVAGQIADKDGRNLHASCAGFINGVGTLGSVVINPIASWASDQNDNSYLWALLVITCCNLLCSGISYYTYKRFSL